jgi:hypothetical protein
MGLTTPHLRKISLLQKIHMSLKLGRIPWINESSDGKRTFDLGHGMYEVCIGQVP